MRNYQQQEKEKLPSRVPGDIIKEYVEPKPTLGAIWEAVNKRYRMPVEKGVELARRENLFDVIEEQVEEVKTLKEAVAFMVGKLVEFDGHRRNIILTPEELLQQRTFNAKVGLMMAYLNGVRAGDAPTNIAVAVSRQAAMRKLTISYGSWNDISPFVQRFFQAGLIQKSLEKNVVTYVLSTKGEKFMYEMKRSELLPEIQKQAEELADFLRFTFA